MNKEFLDVIGKSFVEQTPVKNKNMSVAAKEELLQSDYLVEETINSEIKAGRWAVMGNVYSGCDSTADSLTAGVYEPILTLQGPILVKRSIKMDNLIDLPDPAITMLDEHINKFWTLKPSFTKYGFIHKRGVLLYGPPGGGKTTLVFKTMKMLVEKYQGVVLLGESPWSTIEGLDLLRSIEPDRKCVVVLEDVDAIVRTYGDRALTSLLDGENNIDNVLFLATTNYPDRLPARLIDRPSRFDVIEKIGMPNSEARMVFLTKKTELSPSAIDTWVAKTEDFSVAHLKELIIAVLIYGHNLDDSVEQLKSMKRMKF